LTSNCRVQVLANKLVDLTHFSLQFTIHNVQLTITIIIIF